MHISVHQFFGKDTDASMFTDKEIIEVGSLNVNGTVRDFIMEFKPKSYIGIDIIEGNGVDKILSAEHLIKEFGKDSFDTVVSTEMLEHAENWRECVDNMKAVCRDWMIISTRGPGFPHHEYPHDCWRYTQADFERIFADFDTKLLIDDWMEPGIFYIGRRADKPKVDLDKISLMPAPSA